MICKSESMILMGNIECAETDWQNLSKEWSEESWGSKLLRTVMDNVMRPGIEEDTIPRP